MPASFADHFSPLARQYAESRPGYPPALFAWLAAQCPPREVAWDCGTGNGQAACSLAEHFAQVLATDASAAQIAAATAHPRVVYRVAPAECSGLDDARIDLASVAQALHWFDLPRFYAEARRVLRPGGLLAVWSYGVQRLDDGECDALVQRFYAVDLQGYWPAERRHVENGYRELAFPFEELQAPEFALTAEWRLPQLLGYFRSWSAVARARAALGADPVAAIAAELAAVWGDPSRRRRLSWPLRLRVGRV